MSKITLNNTKIDIDELLAPKPDEEEQYHDFYLENADLRLLARALRGDDPLDRTECQARRRLLRGLCYQLNGYEEVAD